MYDYAQALSFNPLVAELFCHKFDLLEIVSFLCTFSTACSTLAVSNQHPF